MIQHFDYCPSASECDNQSVRSSAPVVSRCFPGGYNVKLYISRGRLAWWLLAFLHSAHCKPITCTSFVPLTVHNIIQGSLTFKMVGLSAFHLPVFCTRIAPHSSECDALPFYDVWQCARKPLPTR